MPVGLHPFKFNSHEILARAAAKFSMSALDFMSPEGCRERIMHIVSEIKPFLVEVRHHEQILPDSQVVGAQRSMNPHNRRLHEMALARLKHSVCSQRIARYAAWAFQASASLTFVRDRIDDLADKVVEIKSFRPACLTDPDGKRLYQVVTFRNPQTDSMALGLVWGVWRGALCRQRKEGDGVRPVRAQRERAV